MLQRGPRRAAAAAYTGPSRVAPLQASSPHHHGCCLHHRYRHIHRHLHLDNNVQRLNSQTRRRTVSASDDVDSATIHRLLPVSITPSSIPSRHQRLGLRPSTLGPAGSQFDIVCARTRFSTVSAAMAPKQQSTLGYVRPSQRTLGWVREPMAEPRDVYR